MKSLIINFFVSLLLFVLATIPTAALTIAVIPFSFVYYILTLKWRTGMEMFSGHLHGIALSADQLANKSLAPLLNVIMVKTDKYHPFGDEDDTLSYVIAMNHEDSTLSGFGNFWAGLLILVDYKAKREGTNHLLKAIKNKCLRDIEAYNRLERQGLIDVIEN